MSDRPRLAIVGPGTIAEVHVPAMRRAGAEVVAVVGRSVEQARIFADTQGIADAYGDLETMLGAHPIDGLVISSPNSLHASQALLALEHGVPTLIEVPVVLHLADVGRLEKASDRYRVPLAAAQTQRYMAPVRQLKVAIGSGAIAPTHGVIRWAFPRLRSVNWQGRERTWTDSLLWHHAGHVVDCLSWLLGAPSTEFVTPCMGRNENGPLDLQMLARFGNVAINVFMSYAASAVTHDLLLVAHGTSFSLDFTVEENGVRRESPSLLEAAVELQDAAFVDLVGGRPSDIPLLRDVAPSLRYIAEIEGNMEAADA